MKNDRNLFVTTIVLVFFGLVMVYSASSVKAELQYGSSTYFVARQAFWVLASVAAMMLLKRTHYKRLQQPAVAFGAIGIVIVLLFIVYFAGDRNHRWLRLGLINIQPAEIAKPAIVVFLAYFVAQRVRAINNRHTLWPAAMAVGLVTIGVGIPDLGTAVVLGITAVVVFFLAGLEVRYCAVLLAIAGLGVTGLVVSKPYRLKRVWMYFDRDYAMLTRLDATGRVKAYMQKSMTSTDTNYQAEQSKIAVGAGGPTGLGLMQGKQKLLYLPEAHTDFIYAVIGEETGLFGTIGVLIGFGVVLWRGLRTATRAPDDFGKFLAIGITTLIVAQAFINMSVVLAMAPTKGIPLPMISFGGNSLLSTLSLMGMLMNVSENAG
ncbi:MAG: FtsW/RodA/SpoVE family cell cycle protein [Bryobacteraceae bacterium]